MFRKSILRAMYFMSIPPDTSHPILKASEIARKLHDLASPLSDNKGFYSLCAH